jgi:endoglucanase
MYKFKTGIAALFMLLLVQVSASAQTNIVEKYGNLKVKGSYIFGQNGDTVQLRGMSLFWSQWMPQYYSAETVKWLKDDWKVTIVRAAMGYEMGGYQDDPDGEKAKVVKVVDAAIQNGIYVIIDFHSHEAHKNLDEAKEFFAEMAKKYGKYPNVLYEIYNEPLKEASWAGDIKPYSEAVIAEIRKHDPDNIIIVGTRQWSQLVNEAASDPIKGDNLVYTLHYYAATHGGWLREEAKKAMDKGIAIFVSEYGTCDASGNGRFDPKKSQEWYAFLDQYKLSHCNWSVADKVETASVLNPGASGNGGWTEKDLTPSGKLVRDEIRAKNGPIYDTLKKKK